METSVGNYRLTLNPGGNIGIGTNAPNARLGVVEADENLIGLKNSKINNPQSLPLHTLR
jgi:hypothetical protein